MIVEDYNSRKLINHHYVQINIFSNNVNSQMYSQITEEISIQTIELNRQRD